MNKNKINEFKNLILDTIKDNEYFDELLKTLDLVSKFIKNNYFSNYLKDIVAIIFEDRNGDNKFDLEDLKLLCNDITALSIVVNAIILLLKSVPQINLNHYNIEDLILKIFIYAFTIIIPKEMKHVWTFQDKNIIIEYIFNMHEIIVSLKITKEAINKISLWFKKKTSVLYYLICYNKIDNKSDIIDVHMLKIKSKLKTVLDKDKEINKLNFDIIKLKNDIDEIKKDTNKENKKEINNESIIKNNMLDIAEVDIHED